MVAKSKRALGTFLVRILNFDSVSKTELLGSIRIILWVKHFAKRVVQCWAWTSFEKKKQNQTKQLAVEKNASNKASLSKPKDVGDFFCPHNSKAPGSYTSPGMGAVFGSGE